MEFNVKHRLTKQNQSKRSNLVFEDAFHWRQHFANMWHSALFPGLSSMPLVRPAAHCMRQKPTLPTAHLLISKADMIYVLIARRPHTRATSQQTDITG